MRRSLTVVLIGLSLVAALVCWQWWGSTRPVVIGSKVFPESRLLATMLSDLVRQRGIPVQVNENLAGTLIAFSALQSGAIDCYVEYTGTGLQEILKEPVNGSPQQVFDRVRTEFERRWQLLWLDPLGFNDSYALAMRADAADRLQLRTISALVPLSPRLTFGASHEFLSRQDGYIGLRRVYGLQFGRNAPLQHGLAYRALLEGKVDVIDANTTDGNLDPASIVVLDDDKHFFPPYYAAPVVRADALRRKPALREALNELAGRIDDPTMKRLNHEVESERKPTREVARDFLQQQGLLARDALQDRDEDTQQSGLLAYMWAHRLDLEKDTLQHLYLTGVSMLLAILVGIPLGILITRWTAAAGAVLGTAGILQTIPSLALLAFMIPYLGLREPPAIAALFLYGLLPIVRNTYTGIRGVDRALLEVAMGMGLTPWQRLTLVELPLAAGVIMAGVRTAVVIAIGTATLAAFIGAGGLGNPIATGLSLNDTQVILSGAIPAALLAVVVDLLLGLVERRIVPRHSGTHD